MRRALPFAIALIAACSSDPAVAPTDAGTDLGAAPGDTPAVTDTPVGTDTPAVTDTPVATDTPATRQCGTERPTITGVRGTEGLVIAADGTIYYSQSHAVGRIRPGMAPEPGWAQLPAAAVQVWGIAIDGANHRLLVASPSTRIIYSVDLTADPPMGVAYLTGAGSPNGVTMGPDGALYYTDFGGGGVFRVTGTDTGTRTRVSMAAIPGADGLAFHRDGTLYVEGYNNGTIYKLTLTGNMETARETVTTELRSPDGIAFDAMDRIYVAGGDGRLVRLDADGTNLTVLRTGISSAANVEFGAGALPCTDIYVASGGALVRYEMGDTAGAAVPWH
jgi:outer membrane protein assembly factor BamB